jgi:hypothetical protein
MNSEELKQSEALHKRKKKFVDGKLARTRKDAHADGLITAEEAAEIHRLQARSKTEGKLIARREEQIANLLVPHGTRFLASAEKVKGEDAGAFVSGAGAKIVWHTTEGRSIDGAVHEFRKNRSWPHFTLNPQTGRLLQHVAMDLSSRALKHPPAVETNRAHAIQVELVGLAAEAPGWDAEDYARIAHLARQIEAATGVSRKALATFRPTQVVHLSPAAWLRGSGHCGHQHVPGNDHHDPGALRIDLVI